jgi:hypothetical protein
MKTKTSNIKHLLLIVAICCLAISGANAQAPQLIVKGLKAPQLNSIQRSGISDINAANAKGQLVYNTESNCIEFWDGGAWRNFCENTRWFYMPSVVIDVSEDVMGETLNLYGEYKRQFDASAPESQIIRNPGAPSNDTFTRVYAKNELNYYIIGYDETVFSNISVSDDGVMTYDVDSSNVSDETYMHIVFVVK